MTVQLNPQSARVAANLNLNNQVAGPSANQAFNAANSSLVSMSPQEGIGDFFQGVWDFVTYPFRAVWNLFFGSSTSPDATDATKKKAEKSDGIPEDFAALFERKTLRKLKADDFRAAFEALPEEEQKAFKDMLWVAGGHKAPIKHKGSWASVLIEKKKFGDADRRHLKQAFEMMKSRETLKELNERLSEKELHKDDIKDIRNDLFKKLPASVKTQVERLGHAIGHHQVGTANFESTKAMAGPYAVACKLLAEGNFVILSKEDRQELAGMRRNLNAAAVSSGATRDHDIDTLFKGLSEKPKALVAEAIGAAIGGSAKDGAKYLANAHYHKKTGAHVPVNEALVRGVVTALSVFNT